MATLLIGVLIGRTLPRDGGIEPSVAMPQPTDQAPSADAPPGTEPPAADRVDDVTDDEAGNETDEASNGEDEANDEIDDAGSGEAGEWTNVTPEGVPLTGGTCDSYGSQTVAVDPNRPSDVYAQINCLGIWKSTDFGQRWTGPINTGRNGVTAGDCAGGISIGAAQESSDPILYQACIRGAGMGFWRSLDGGVNWTRFAVSPRPDRQDFAPPVVDPSDSSHLIAMGHEFNMIVESVDGGEHWKSVPMSPDMNQEGGTAFLFIVNTGDPVTTKTTWLYTAQATGGVIGTWRTDDAGATWTRVEQLEGPHGNYQPYQSDAGGVVYMGGIYGSDGDGVYRSDDYGQTWTHVGDEVEAAGVFGTPNRVYAGYSWACGDCEIAANFQTAAQPGESDWSRMEQPSGMSMGPAEVTTTFDGANYILISANWRDGLWRYVEP